VPQPSVSVLSEIAVEIAALAAQPFTTTQVYRASGVSASASYLQAMNL
jgi:hypothetical protein